MYFWYSRGIELSSRFSGSLLRMYQLVTSSMPSGLACTARMITSRRKRIVSSSVRVTSW